LSGNQTKELGSFSKTIYHEPNGKRYFTIDGWFDIKVTLSGTPYNRIELTETGWWLNDIPRASSVSSGISFVAGTQNLDVSINRAVNYFTHDMEFWVQHPNGTWNWILNRGGIGASTTVNFTVAENTLIYDSINMYEERPVKIKLYTYNGSTLIGTTEKFGTVYAHNTGWPSFSNYDIGGNTIPITIGNWASQFTYDIYLYFGSYTKSRLGVTTQTTSLVMSQDDVNSMYQQIPNSNQGVGEIVVRTKYNGVLIEDGIPTSNKRSFTANVIDSFPTLDNTKVRYVDINQDVVNVTLDNQYIVQNKSRLQAFINVAAVPKNYATISRYEVKVNGTVISKLVHNDEFIFNEMCITLKIRNSSITPNTIKLINSFDFKLDKRLISTKLLLYIGNTSVADISNNTPNKVAPLKTGFLIFLIALILLSRSEYISKCLPSFIFSKHKYSLFIIPLDVAMRAPLSANGLYLTFHFDIFPNEAGFSTLLILNFLKNSS